MTCDIEDDQQGGCLWFANVAGVEQAIQKEGGKTTLDVIGKNDSLLSSKRELS